MLALTRSTLLRTALAAVILTGCATPPKPVSIADTAARTPELSTLNRLITQAGLADTLRGPGPFTVFAPSDDAFKAVPAKTLADLGADKELLRSLLSYHVVPGAMPAASIKNGNVKTVNGANLALSKAGGIVTLEDAVVLNADIAATNGVVHVIDRVLFPPRR